MNFQQTTLPSGLRIATETLPGVETVSIAISVDAGARHETPTQNGISHVLEHMAFKGTPTRNAREIAEAFDDIGGALNAYTSQENTVYYAKILHRDVPVAMEMLGDILLNSTFEEQELAREQQVILQEIAMHADTPDDYVFDLFHAAVWPNQALGRSILGTEAHVAGFTRADLFGYLRAHYTPARMVVSAAGKIDHDAFVRLVTQHFNPPAAGPTPALEAAKFKGGDAREEKDLEQLHLALGFPGVTVHDADFHAAQVLATILGGGMSSRLFQEVREKRGLVYHVSAFSSSYADTGLIGVYAAASPDKTAEMMPVLCDEIRRLRDGGVTEAERARGIRQQVAGLLMARESTSSVAEWMGKHLLTYGVVHSAEELTARIEAVTAADIARVAERMLAGGLAMGAYGPLATLEGYEATVERLAG